METKEKPVIFTETLPTIMYQRNVPKQSRQAA